MTQQFEEAWAAVAKLPEEQQNVIAAIVQQLASEEFSTEAFSKLAEFGGQKQTSEKLLTEVADSQTQPTKIELPEEKKGQAAESGEILTLEEIYSRYPNKWVMIAYTELDEDLNVIRGQVLASSPDRDELYSELSLRKGKAIAIEYTGIVPDNIVMMLWRKMSSYQKAYRLLSHGQNLLKVQATVGGKDGDVLEYRVSLLVDTGASFTILPVQSLKDLGYDTENPIRYQPIVTGSGIINAPVVSVLWFNCVGQTLDNFEIAAYHIPVNLRIDGLLGMDFLKLCQAIISVGEAEIRCQKL